MAETRVVCLNCIDGRVQIPVIEWIKGEFKADYVDMITEPGIDGLLADAGNSIETIVKKVGISVEKNHASLIFVVGHYDCKGNPAEESTHKKQILQSVQRLKEEFIKIDIVGLWVNQEWQPERV